jgi:inner membrane protein
MDSITQIALGAAVSEAVMQNKVGRKATLWGAILGTLPDLDVLIPMGNAVKDFTYHRAESHAFFYMALVTPLIVWLITKIHPKTKEHKARWFILVFLTFITHALLDSFTIYGTQIFLPFSEFPVGWSTIFVIDPLYTIPLLLGVSMVFIITKNSTLAQWLNLFGILISSVYLIWCIGVKSYVISISNQSLSNQKITVSQSIVSPSPFNTILWRVVGITDSGYVEGFYSIFDNSENINFKFYPSKNNLLEPISNSWDVQRLQWFTKGFYKVENKNNRIVISDLRMGFGDYHFFNFVVGKKVNNNIIVANIEKLEPKESDNLDPLKNLWLRIWDENVVSY